MPLPRPSSVAARVAGWVATGTRTIARDGRDRWVAVSGGRVHIEMRGLRDPQGDAAASQVRRELRALDWVRGVEINAVLGVVVVSCDPEDHRVDELVRGVAAAEAAPRPT